MSTERFQERLLSSSKYIAPTLEANGYFGCNGGYDFYGKFIKDNLDLGDIIRDESISDVHLTSIICRRFDEWFTRNDKTNRSSQG